MTGKRKPSYVVQLVGGLGNQLFGYFAGHALAAQSGAEVMFDISQLDKGFTAHGSSITDLISMDLVEEKSIRKQVLRKLAAVSESATYGATHFQRALQSLFGIYTSRVVGFDPELLSQRAKKFIRGYFQTYEYVHIAKDAIPTIVLQAPSIWFRKMEAKASVEKPVMVHVRRGDYVKLKMEFGLLSKSYFMDAISSLLPGLPSPLVPIWVFSDDVEQVKREWEGIGDHNFVFVEVPPEVSDAESLILMSKGAANVISNSTFSWWSAMLNPGAPVVAPSKWFRGKADPVGLIPESWIRVESQWKD